jgi:hypothetical protein
MNKFFDYNDIREDNFLFKLNPDTWWSRLYEYIECIRYDMEYA